MLNAILRLLLGCLCHIPQRQFISCVVRLLLKTELDKLLNYAIRKVDIHDQEQKQLAERVA
jgi:hypothetical protein